MILPWYSPPSCMCAALPPAAGAACVQCAPAGCDSVCGCGWREGVDPSIHPEARRSGSLSHSETLQDPRSHSTQLVAAQTFLWRFVRLFTDVTARH
ncbi:hypothetical protein PR003_g438 [Phytophthora rubi]|uniref:Uncharacterized protein n=2 Tax=Phytophthora TaxID=4783 RepID=A0A6A3LZG5_9STRA|nr:hypothetical protein PF011_g3097 [Phytophthora fragariae]KAE9048893.1 hypothetical protein PR002_g174 [Phytophthora rubi]KAE9049994.1 hypothetical protein PR001_g2819 [Phytophthora rubi]KAE9357164.1 hypothetical protein PF008_g3282 [Phytophthora fragariae]KAE9360003.1 hypothetical protein PR003_g438 [Phytophthora rubi]